MEVWKKILVPSFSYSAVLIYLLKEIGYNVLLKLFFARFQWKQQFSFNVKYQMQLRVHSIINNWHSQWSYIDVSTLRLLQNSVILFFIPTHFPVKQDNHKNWFPFQLIKKYSNDAPPAAELILLWRTYNVV